LGAVNCGQVPSNSMASSTPEENVAKRPGWRRAAQPALAGAPMDRALD